jgi:hypothetical protein
MTQTEALAEPQDEYEMGGGPGAPTPVSTLVVSDMQQQAGM